MVLNDSITLKDVFGSRYSEFSNIDRKEFLDFIVDLQVKSMIAEKWPITIEFQGKTKTFTSAKEVQELINDLVEEYKSYLPDA